MKLKITFLISFLLVLAMPTTGITQDTARKGYADVKEVQTPAPSFNYGGDLWTRSALTGDWWGTRTEMAEKGITFDLSLTQVGQGVVGGGKDQSWEYGGRGNLTVNADSQKLGLWPGGFMTLEVEGNFENSVNLNTGALMPVNSNQLYPVPTGDNLDVNQLSFTQFLSPYAGLFLGKLDTLYGGDANEFAHGKGDVQFFNMAFNFNPVALVGTPYSPLGAGVIVLPTKDPKAAIVSFSVFQTNGNANTTGFSDLSANKLTFAGEGRVRTDFFGLTGHQLFGAEYSNNTFASIDQDLRLIIENHAIEEKKGSWNIHYNFDQYLYEPKKGSGQGAGIFGRFGASDGNPNPLHYFFSIGVGGKGIIPSRPLDRFGLGYYYIDVNNPELQGPFRTREFLRDEYGVEAFYNVAITPWMLLTPNIQVVKPSQKKEVISRENIDTDTVLGIRLQLIF